MKKNILHIIVFACLGLMLSACFGPKTPQDVTLTFWEAVLNNETEDAVKYSTLTEGKYYDSFSEDWSGFQPSFGKVTIEENQASIVSEFNSPANSGLNNRSFTTYLIRHNDEWKVDYDRTKQSIHGGAIGELFNKVDKLSDDLSKQFESSTDSLKLEIDRMSKKFDQMSDSIGQKASKSVEKYSDQLRERIKEIEESINRALKEEDENLSDEDRQTLRRIVTDLDQGSEGLSNPNMKAVASGSNTISETQKQLEMISNDSLDKYKQEWRELNKRIEADMREMLDELSYDEKD